MRDAAGLCVDCAKTAELIAVADPGSVQTPALLFSCLFLKKNNFENMSLRFLGLNRVLREYEAGTIGT